MPAPIRKYVSHVFSSELEKLDTDDREALLTRLTPDQVKEYSKRSVLCNAELIYVIRIQSKNAHLLTAVSRNGSFTVNIDVGDYIDLKNKTYTSNSLTGMSFIVSPKVTKTVAGDRTYELELVETTIKWGSAAHWIFSEKL